MLRQNFVSFSVVGVAISMGQGVLFIGLLYHALTSQVERLTKAGAFLVGILVLIFNIVNPNKSLMRWLISTPISQLPANADFVYVCNVANKKQSVAWIIVNCQSLCIP